MADLKILNAISDIRRTTENALTSGASAVPTQLILFEVTEIIGRWNVTVHLLLNSQRSEIARAEDITGPGVYVLEPRVRFTHPTSLVPVPNLVRYFTTSEFARLSGNLWIAGMDSTEKGR